MIGSRALDSIREWFQRGVACFRHTPMDRDFEAEVTAHLAFAVEENTRSGMSPEEARRRALIRFGGVQQSRERHRDARGVPGMDTILRDLRHTLRAFRRDRGFTFTAVLILGLGIGANVAVFSVVDGILLRPFPFRDPQQLVWIAQTKGPAGLAGSTISVDAFDEFRERNHSFQDVTAWFAFSPPENIHLRGNGDPLPITGISVVENFFRVLGVAPRIGRLFTAEECRRNGSPAVLLAYPFWQRQFAGDPAVVGRSINLDGKAVTVVGVLPETFDFASVFSPGARVDMFTPVILDDMVDWGRILAPIGRLKPGVSAARAQAEADILGPELDFNIRRHVPKGYYTVGITPLKEYVSGKLRRALIVMWCAVGLILLIVCVNLSNLLLARAGARAREFAMRAALGAGRGRLLGQLLTESLVLSGAGALTGLGFAWGITTWLAHQGSVALPLLNTVRVDSAALAWTLFIAVGAAVICGLVPGLKMSGRDLQSSLKDMSHGMSAGKGHQRLRAALVVSEVALACVLLVGAGLLLRSFLRVLDVDLGFQPARAAAIGVDYPDDVNLQQRTGVREEILRRVEAIPGIQSAGITDELPLEGNRSMGLWAKGTLLHPGEYPLALAYVVTPGYFDAMGIRLLEGRQFDWHDRAGSQAVVILNETAARLLFPGKDPLGQIAVTGDGDTRVVGIVPDVHDGSPEGKAGPQMYVPVGQTPPIGTILVVRSSLPAAVLEPSLMRALRSINPTQPAYKLVPIQSSVDRAVSPRRFFMLLVTAFAALGLILAALGIYGVISYSVVQQTQEIGIRMALGATAGRVQAGILSQTLRLTVMGVAMGTVASLAVARLIASLLFDTAPTDPATFTAMMILLGSAALLAGFLPAQRASRLDPVNALRTI
jgi:predicted permease